MRILFTLIFFVFTVVCVILLVRVIKINRAKQSNIRSHNDIEIFHIKHLLSDFYFGVAILLILHFVVATLVFAIDPFGYFGILGDHGFATAALSAFSMLVVSIYAIVLMW